jgi:hypothetical protein
MTKKAFHTPPFFELLPDPTLREPWFPTNPYLADGSTDVRLLGDKQLEKYHRIENGRRVEVLLLPTGSTRYSLSVYPNGACEIDPREFTEGRRYGGPIPVMVRLEIDGTRPQFTFASHNMPIVSHPLAKLIGNICSEDVQRLPITVGPSITGYEILNVVATADCLDEALSEFVEKWTLEHGRRDKVGQYRAVGRLKIDSARTDNRGVFRIRGWEGALIVSHKVRMALERIANLGVVFNPVS